MTDTSTRPFRLLIGGDAVEPGDGTYEVVNPATEQVVAEAPNASVADAEAACAAAKAALPAWKRTSPAERSALLLKVADLLDAAKDELVPLAKAETGATMRVVKSMQVPQSAMLLRINWLSSTTSAFILIRRDKSDRFSCRGRTLYWEGPPGAAKRPAGLRG